MLALPVNSVLLVIDVQQAFNNPVWGERNNPCAELNISVLLAEWRRMHYPVVHIHHVNPSPTSLFNGDQHGVLVKDEAMPIAGEPIFSKCVNSAFIGTELETELRAKAASTLVIVGLTTDHCVSTTARMAANLGFITYVISDATATFERIGPDGRHWEAQMVHDSALASLNNEFATVISTEEVLSSISGQSAPPSLEQRESLAGVTEYLRA